jgi:hypothetical protein
MGMARLTRQRTSSLWSQMFRSYWWTLVMEKGNSSLSGNRQPCTHALYYLLHIGEYTIKSKHNNSKQMVQFKLKDARFFNQNNTDILMCLPKNAPLSLLLTADSDTLKFDNQKNRWMGVSMHLEANGEEFKCPV